MEIKRIICRDFKGLPDGEYEFGHVTRIKGVNGSCKSTLAMIPLWILNDIDYAFHSNPLVAPLFKMESNPTATMICDIDGTEVSITKSQTNKVIQDGDVVKRSSTNKYLVNDVPITLKEFKSKLLSYGIDTDKTQQEMHPMAFTSGKADDMKKILFDMASEKTDLDIAKMGDDTPHLATLLTQYSVDEVSAKYKASKKKSDEMIKAIPDRIIGMESSKSQEDPEPLKQRQNEIALEIKSLSEQAVAEDKSGEMEEIRSQLFEAKRNTLNFEKSIAEKETAYKRKLAEAVLVCRRESQSILDERNVHKTNLFRLKDQVESAERAKANATTEYRKLKADKPPVFEPPKELTEQDMICPCCGQKLPEKIKKQKMADYKGRYATAKEEYDRGLAAWKMLNEKGIERVTAEGQTACDSLRDLAKKISEEEELIKKLDADLAEKFKALESAEEAEKVPFNPSTADLQQKDKLLERENYLTQLLQSCAEIAQKSNKVEIDAKVQALQKELEDIAEALGRISRNDDINAAIEKLQAERMAYEQAKADAEQILYELDILSRKKNDLLVEEINSHFSLVKFQLFEYQKNGNYREICVPTIDGFRFGESTNTGREIRGKLDICQSLQKFYGANLPIILDNAESINDFNIPEIDSQLILLTVTDDKNLVIEHD